MGAPQLPATELEPTAGAVSRDRRLHPAATARRPNPSDQGPDNRGLRGLQPERTARRAPVTSAAITNTRPTTTRRPAGPPGIEELPSDGPANGEILHVQGED